MYMYMNNELIDSVDARISVFEHGFLYGMGLFETFRTYEGVPFLFERHMERLGKACQMAGLPWQRHDQRLLDQMSHLLDRHHLEDGYFRYNLSAGEHPIGLPEHHYEQVTEILFVKPIAAPPKSKKLKTVQTIRNTPETPIRLKSHHYMNNIVARWEVSHGEEGIFLSKGGHVAEGVVSNLFFVYDQHIYTPSSDTGLLQGITRAWLIEHLQNKGYQVEEGLYSLAFAQHASEVFVCNSIQQVVEVVEWDDIIFPAKQTGPQSASTSVTQTIQEDYAQAIQDYIKIRQ